MYWTPDDDLTYHGGPFQREPRSDQRLRHVVFLDGRLIDTWAEPVEGTAYHSWAQELDRAAQPRVQLPVFRPPHEAVLDWLDGVVGGRIALLALDDEPLERGQQPVGTDPSSAEVVTLLELVCRELFDDELLAAACAALTDLRNLDPVLLDATPSEVAGGLLWMVGRANGVVGARTPVTQKVLRRVLWLKFSPTPRTTRFRACLRGLLPSPTVRPRVCPDLLELGSPAFLTSRTRRELIGLRDRALAAGEAAAMDEQARAVVLP